MGNLHRTVEETTGGTVADVMLERPKTLPADSSVAAVRGLFEKPSVRTALLVEGAVFRAAFRNLQVILHLRGLMAGGDAAIHPGRTRQQGPRLREPCRIQHLGHVQQHA